MQSTIFQYLNSKLIHLIILVFSITAVSSVHAQWTAVNNGLANTSITSMFTYVDTLIVGTNGGGIFKSTDNGDTWTNISGNIGNLNINDIRGGGGPQVIWAATAGGAFHTTDHANYSDNTSTGLSTTNISYYWFGDSNDPNTEWAIGTNNGGVFTSPNLEGPWNNANSGISGNGLFINDISGYDDGVSDYSVLATNDGMYFSGDTMKSWVRKANGLTGGALFINKIFALGTALIIFTDDGIYFSTDAGDTFVSLISGEVLNTFAFSFTGYGMYAFGTNGFHTLDFVTWDAVDMTGVSGGEVTASALNSQFIFIGTQSGGVFRKNLVTGIISSVPIANKYELGHNYPNPFNPVTTIPFTLPRASHVQILVFDINGKLVAELLNDKVEAGNHKIELNGSDLASGTYFLQMLAGNKTFLNKIILIK